MNIIDALILIILVFVAYKYYTCTYTESFDAKTKQIKQFDDFQDYVVNDPKKYIDRFLKSKKVVEINPFFLESQFHQDYRDTINAFNIIVPNQRQVFNRSDAPLVNESVPPITEVKRLIGSFIKEVNKVVNNQVESSLSLTNWNDMMPQKQVKSGWDKVRNQLGLESTIYNDTVNKAPVKLLKIDHLEKYQTEDQIRYVAFLIIQKKNVEDQMTLKISFVLDTNDVNLDREFFDEEKSVYETAVKIEEIFVLGFMTKTSRGEQSSSLQDLYNFDGIKNNGITSDKAIMEELAKKKKVYEDECYQ